MLSLRRKRGQDFSRNVDGGAAEGESSLSIALRRQVTKYLQNEWRTNPPFKANAAKYLEGGNRAPYEVPRQDIRLLAAFNREKGLRQSQPRGLYSISQTGASGSPNNA